MNTKKVLNVINICTLVILNGAIGLFCFYVSLIHLSGLSLMSTVPLEAQIVAGLGAAIFALIGGFNLYRIYKRIKFKDLKSSKEYLWITGSIVLFLTVFVLIRIFLLYSDPIMFKVTV
ncbi:MAG: hypothetical protein M3Q44_04210 [bacterium]|nr:hypothetical protein [bacterium]